MGTVDVDVAPSLLQWATNRAGWDADVVATRVPQLQAWIDGEKRPTLKQLERFAHATHAPLGMLFLPAPPVEEIPISDMRTMRDAGVREPSTDLLETIYICQRGQGWYRDYASGAGAAPSGIVGSVSIEADPVDAASRLRGLLWPAESAAPTPSDALRDLIEHTEALGVLFMVSGIVGSDTHRTLRPSEARGFTLADDVAPLVFVNGADAKTAQVFTLAHELAHVVLGHSARSDASFGRVSDKAEEHWCNAVAAELLVPMERFTASFRGSV